jgi:hypothetical protein
MRYSAVIHDWTPFVGPVRHFLAHAAGTRACHEKRLLSRHGTDVLEEQNQCRCARALVSSPPTHLAAGLRASSTGERRQQAPTGSFEFSYLHLN